jgi:hypothetical protein
MTIILALLVLFGIGKAVEQMSYHTAVAGCYDFNYAVPRGFRAYRPGVVYHCYSRVSQLKLNYRPLLLVAIAWVAWKYGLHTEGGLSIMTLMTTSNKENPHLKKLKEMWMRAVNESRLNYDTVTLRKNSDYVAKYVNVIGTEKSWDFHDSCIRTRETSFDMPVNEFSDRFQGDIWHIAGVWGMKYKMRKAFLDSLFAHLKSEGMYFHMTEKTSECFLYVGTKEQFEHILGVLPKASKFKKTLAAIASAVPRYTITGLPNTIDLVAIDPTQFGYRKHVGDGTVVLKFNLEYMEGKIRHTVGAVQARFLRFAKAVPTGITKQCVSFGVNAGLVWEDIKANIDANIPDTAHGAIFLENIKGGFEGIKHGDIITIDTRTELIVLKKAKAPGTNRSQLGGQLQIATICQSKEFKAQLLAKSLVHHTLGLMKHVWDTGSLDAMHELGFNRGDDLSKIISRLFFDDLRDRRTIQVHKASIYRKFLDKVRKCEHDDLSWSAYAVGLIQLGLAEKWHYEHTGEVKHFALTPYGCDVESICARYPATSNHSAVCITPVQQLLTHDVIMIANSTDGWLSWLECNFGDWDGDMLAVYRGLVAGHKNIYPALTEIPTDKMEEPLHYIDGIIGATNAAIIAKASISESDRAVRYGFMLLFVNMYEGKVKLTVDMLAKLVQDTASMRETFIKSQKRTEVNGKQVSIEAKILSMFPQVTASEIGKEVAEMLFFMTTADGGIGLSALEEDRLNAVVNCGKKFMQPKYAKFHGILNSFPFIQTICGMSQFADLDYNMLDEKTLVSMHVKGQSLIKKYSNDDMDKAKMHRFVNRIGFLVNQFNSAMKSKDLSVLVDNPLFSHVTTMPDNDERWKIQATAVKMFFAKIMASCTEAELMVYIGMVMTGWDNSKADKFEGFGCYTTPSGFEFRRRGHIFWMLPKEMLARAAFALATRDEYGDMLNPFLRNANTSAELADLLDNYVTTEEQVEEELCLDVEVDDADICLNFI